jgi:hypothetical protein
LNRISGALHGTDKDISATWMKTAWWGSHHWCYMKWLVFCPHASLKFTLKALCLWS